MFSKIRTEQSTKSCSQQIESLQEKLNSADAVLIGAGAGLSVSAGFTYDGERFERYFSDFEGKYGFRDMYSGGFYPFPSAEERWAYWSRYIFINRYMNAEKPVYERLLAMVRDKEHFVLTTNVDHCFRKAGFDKRRLFYTQGDYGLFQCSEPCCQKTYDNEAVIRKMVEAQGYTVSTDGTLCPPENAAPKMTVPTELVPHCPVCGRPMSMNLRADDTFVEDDGWHAAAERYSEFLRKYKNSKLLLLELGVGFNTPGIIKYPFWLLTAENPNAVYACVNPGQTPVPHEIAERSICIKADVEAILRVDC